MKNGLRSDVIKIIAMLCMLIDHTGVCLSERLYVYILDAKLAYMILEIGKLFRIVGRIAFPIFCYQLVVGFFYTKNKKKHIIYLAIFALISEIPFNLLDSFSVSDPGYQNVMFTLLVGMLVLCAIDKIYDYSVNSGYYNNTKDKVLLYSAATLIVLAASLLVELTHTDYGAKGVILVVLFYIMFKSDNFSLYMVAVLFLIEVAIVTYFRGGGINRVITYCETEAFALLAFPIIALDNGKRRGGNILKWFGYMFYPCHMLLLFLIFNSIVN